MAICDPFLNVYLETGEIIERVALTDKIEGVFMRAKREEIPMINYPYRLICYQKDDRKLILTVNLEVSAFGTCCLGAHSKDCHHNFGPADKNMSYEDFKEKAVEIALKLIRNNMFWDNINLEDIKPYLVE